MRRWLVLVALVSAASASASAPPVRINGWYRCSASTLSTSADTTEFHSSDYYIETADDAEETAATAVKSRQRHPHTSTVKKSRKPHGLGRSHAPGEAAMLGDPLAFAQSHAQWRAHRDATATAKGHRGGPHPRKQMYGDDTDEWRHPRYECAEFRVPYCYDGICESNRTLDVFVKRVVAKHDAATNQSLWVLQGGPGASSTAMEDLMETVYNELNGAVSIYTMDHRGTARSNRLECQAAEAQTPGSPGGTYVVIEETPNCIDDILFKTDNLTAAFSVTSAAMDLRTIIDHSLANQEVFVYGLSYGTYLVERLMHVPPASLKGFVIDGIVSEAGATIEERSTYSNWDHDVGVVGARFLSYCEANPYCNSKFPNAKNLTKFVKDLYVKLDKAADRPGTNACADALRNSGKRPSYFLRSAFSELLMDSSSRAVIPAVVFRAARCTRDDAQALQFFVDLWAEDDAADTDVDLDDVLFTSQMLYSVIVFSEMWEYPSPDIHTLIQWYEDAVMGSDNYANLAAYCLFTGSRERACKELKHLPRSKPMRYERDAYWNATATLAPDTSVLLLSGGLDLQTRRMYGNLQYELLQGDRMLVQFDYAGHCTTFTTPTKSGGPTCGVQILASYVRNHGDVARVDTSCVGDVYGLDFHVTSAMAFEYLGVGEAYD